MTYHSLQHLSSPHLPVSAGRAVRHQSRVPLPQPQVDDHRAAGQLLAVDVDVAGRDDGRRGVAVLQLLVQVGAVQSTALHVPVRREGRMSLTGSSGAVG